MSATILPTAPYQHPAWCSGGRNCDPPRTCNDGTVEWDHAVMTVVEGLDTVADVFLTRMDSVSAAGVHRVHSAVVLTATGSMNAEQARAYARAILTAADLLDGEL